MQLRLKVFFDYSHLERTYYLDVEWPQTPRVGDELVLVCEPDVQEGEGRTIAKVVTVLWQLDGSADVYLDTPNDRDLCFGLQRAGWIEQDPDPNIAT
jgi:hypothetical protein